ncbi:TPA: TetR/AcrR family transcriptional regulator, partial [Escherichia coli]
MDTHPKHLPADERRAVTVESVVALAGSQNPSEITTAAIAKHMNLTQGALFR